VNQTTNAKTRSAESTGTAAPTNRPRISSFAIGVGVVVLALAYVGLGAYFLHKFWDISVEPVAGSTDPGVASLEAARALEVVKASLQLLFVGALSVVVTIGIAFWQTRRQEAMARDTQAREDEAETERHEREEFIALKTLLDETSTCASEMYMACQHVWRVRDIAGEVESDPYKAKVVATEGFLDRKYLAFAAEANAIQVRIDAGYKSEPAPSGPRIEATSGDKGADSRANEKALKYQPINPAPGQASWRWHQIRDLLTVYYFSLLGERVSRVLPQNSIGATGFHSGIPFTDEHFLAGDKPNIEVIQWTIRNEFGMAQPAFAKALRLEREAPQPVQKNVDAESEGPVAARAFESAAPLHE
jgi:hypothetical protein